MNGNWMIPNQLRPLLVAEAANPDWASVPLIGWSLATALMAISNGHLVTQIRNREAILKMGLIEGEQVTFLDSEAVAAPLSAVAKVLTRGKAWTLNTAIGAIAYYEFERLLWKQFGHRIEQHEFDVVHRITPLSPVVPSLLARKCARAGVPFVLGPLNGGVPWPREFRAARHQEREWLTYLRGAYKLLPGYASTREYASAIPHRFAPHLVVGGTEISQEVPLSAGKRCRSLAIQQASRTAACGATSGLFRWQTGPVQRRRHVA